MNVLITGANGFVGRALCERAASEGYVVHGLTRSQYSLPTGVRRHVVVDWSDSAKLESVLDRVSVVVHAAARVHVGREPIQRSLAEFRKVNVEGTLLLARRAVIAGVRRFVFMSSIGVNGAATSAGAFSPADIPMPSTAYAISKCHAEQGLRSIAMETGLEVVIIRPPLIYGPKAPGNFGALVRALSYRLPLPLGGVTNNRKSYVAIDNLVDLIITCLIHPAAASQTFLVSDGEDLSTAELLRRLGSAMGRPTRLFSVPDGVLALGANMFGKAEMYQSLCGSLQIDMSATQRLLGWSPPIAVDEGLLRAVKEQAC